MATYSDPYDLEQDAFLRQMDPGRNQSQPVGPPAAMTDPIAPPAALAEPPPMAPPSGPTGNGMDARDALGGYNGPMPGFRTDDYGGDVKARNSMKNTAGRIFSRYGGPSRSAFEAIFDDPNDPNDPFDRPPRMGNALAERIADITEAARTIGTLLQTTNRS